MKKEKQNLCTLCASVKSVSVNVNCVLLHLINRLEKKDDP